jgi:tetratricopeptide (TPR) repeat protein
LRRAVELADALAQESSGVPDYRALQGSMHEELGFFLEHVGRYDEAEANYWSALDHFQALATAYPNARSYQQNVLRARMWLGELLWATDRRSEATEQVQQAAALGEQLAPLDPFAAYLYAWLLADCADPTLREPDKAERFSRTATESLRGVGEGWITLGVALYRLGNFEDAIKALERGVSMPTIYDVCTAHYFLAMAYSELGQKDRAMQCYEAGLTKMSKEYDMLEYRRVRDESAKELGLSLPTDNTPRAEPERPTVQTPTAVSTALRTTHDN